MTRPRAEILANRLAVVLALGEANAAQNKAVAGAGGAEIARLAAVGRPGASDPGDDHDLDNAQRRLAEADARVAELETELAALDAELAAGEH
ncbi:MAG: hypothetical protein AAFV86_19970 [Pseudomonadota bacterium]